VGVIFLALFAITLFVLYIAIRRGWGDTLTTGGIGAILSLLWVVLYALLYEETSVAQALFAGVVVGVGFAVFVIIVARFFRANQPPPGVTLVSHTQPLAQETHDERRSADRQETE